MDATILSLIGIFVSLAFIIFLALRGVGIIVIAPLAVVVVSLFSNMSILGTLSGPYMKGFVNYAGKFYLIFLTAAMFGKFMEDSGAARAIAEGLLKVVGRSSAFVVMVSISVICMILTLGGVSLFVVIFAIVPIARPLFKELNVPWHLFMASFMFGNGAITMCMMPGTPSVLNIMPTKYMASTPMAAPVIGLVGIAVVVLFNLWYFKRELKKSANRGEVYEEPQLMGGGGEDKYADRKLPNIWLSLLPPAALILSLNVGKVDIVWALVIGSVVAIAAFWPNYQNFMDTVNKGALNTVVPVINTCADVGYGMAVAATAGFAVVSDILLNLPGHPILSLSVAVNLMAGITGSASGGLGIVLETLAPKYLALGLNPELVHRIAVISAGVFDALPHNGVVITSLAVCGLTHKNAYRHIWMTHCIATLLALIVIIPVGIMIYK
ncbi:MAG: GntP family permease [Firmicutes bacterium]|nr:GntP family permease [Bacillota bacterium]